MGKKQRLAADEKANIVEAYLSGREGRATILQKYGTAWSTLRDWVRLYETRGIDGLMSYSKSRKYTAEIKITAVREYLEGKGSHSDICKKFDISSTSMLRKWIKWYNCHGEFKQPKTGGAVYMAKGRKTTKDERIEIVSHCIASNKDYNGIIKQYGVSYSQLYGWVRKYENEGASGLLDRRGKRKTEESMTEVEKLQAQLKLQKAENLRLQM